MTADPGEFKKLIADIHAGSEEAAWALTERYGPHILVVIRSRLPNSIRSKVDSFDCLQSIWATIFLEPNCLSDISSPKQLIAYLAGVARNKVIDKHRKYSSKKAAVDREEKLEDASKETPVPLTFRLKRSDPMSDGVPSPSHFLAVREAWEKTLSTSSLQIKEIVALRKTGMQYQHIASQLGIDESTVRRAVRRLVHEFQQQ